MGIRLYLAILLAKYAVVNAAETAALLTNAMGEGVLAAADFEAPQPWLEVPASQFLTAVAYLQRTEGLYYDQLACLTGMDHGPEADRRFAVVYHLYSLTQGHSLVVKCFAVARELAHPKGAPVKSWPVVPSLTSLYGAADWHEREAYDLVGIYFEGHPDLRRMLLPEDWHGHPLQKDYQEEAAYHGITIGYYTDDPNRR